MNARQKQKLERYLKNASRFLWGLGPGNQKDNYLWLRGEGFEFNGGSYSHVTNQLLERHGVEEIINRLVRPRVEQLFSPKAIDFLRDCWCVGTMPNASFLSLYNIGNASPFVEINTQFNYVERWGELAGLWFEEIEQPERPMDED